MRLFLQLVLLIGTSLPAQKAPVVSITGTVVDSNGKAVSGARIAHIADLYASVEADASGRFSVQTNRPAIVIRKPGYVSRFFRTDRALPAQVTLDAATPRPVCEPVRIPGMKESSQRDIDYTTVFETIETPDGPRSIRHGNGPLWSSGQPFYELVWSSVEYTEVMYASWIVDARGKTAGGRYWRYFGRVGESSDYEGVNLATAEIFNRKMDGDCSKKLQP